MGQTLTFNAKTLLWHTGTTGAVIYPPYEYTADTGYPLGPYACTQVMTPLNVWDGLSLDPEGAWYPNGGAYWKLTTGPYAGKLVYAYTNARSYGDITIGTDNPDYTLPTEPVTHNINPLANWRILIKAMKGGGGGGLTVPSGTILWHLGTTGTVIMPPYESATVSGTYTYESIMVPLNRYANQLSLDPSGAWFPNGGSYYKITSGPYTGKLVYKWSAERGYGEIVAAPQSGSDARGPGEVLATLYRPEAHLAGASINYNSPGELHFTLLVDDPNIKVPQPKRTHYAVEFETAPGSDEWVEVFAGLIWDFDATDTEVVFYGIDYLGLLRTVIDERFDPNAPTKPVDKGGSLYSKRTVKQIIAEQLNYAIGLENSPVGFMTAGHIDDDLNKYRISKIYSTFQNSLDFIVGLINSYRAGTGMYTRLHVIKHEDGTYAFLTEKDPGEARPGLELEYGNLAQGYRIIPFGPSWGTRVHLIGRTVDGTKVDYVTQAGAALEAEWGRVSSPAVIVETQDHNDLTRRTLQAAVDAAALGRQIGVGIKLGAYRPLEGYDLCDWVPVDIEHGAVDTPSWGSDPFGGELVDNSGIPVSSGMWCIIGLSWESFDDGHWITNAQLWPKNHVPYEPGGEEPDYGQVGGSGAAGCVAYELTGVDPVIAFKSAKVNPDGAAWHTAQFGTVSGLDSNRAAIVLGGFWEDKKNCNAPSGWIEDVDADCGTGPRGIYTMHQLFDPVDNPLPSSLAPIVTRTDYDIAGGTAMILAGFYASEAGVPPTIRQCVYSNESLPGAGVGIDWDEPPLNGSLLIAFVGAGGYFGSFLERGNVHHLDPIDQVYTHVGWTDSGLGQIYSQVEFNGEPVYFECEYRLPYYTEGVEHPPTSYGLGPPTDQTELADVYTDLSTGIQYQYDWATGLWTKIPGSGNAGSGIYDFAFPTVATTWVITHTLGGYPRVTLRDTSGTVIIASIHYDSTTQITVTFSSAVAGSAHLD